MSDRLNEFQLSLADFDRKQLPASQRGLDGDAFSEAVREHFSQQFIGSQGAAEVVVTGDRIIVRWADSVEGESLVTLGIAALRDGDYQKGISTLRLALQRNPADADALFNLALALSEEGKLEEAVELLERLLAEHSSHGHGWVALGVSQARMGRDPAAVDSLRMAVSLNPNDGYSQKNLGAILSKCGLLEEGNKHLRLATQLLPADPQPWLNLAMGLEEAEQLEEADEAYLKVLSLDSAGPLGQKAEEGRSRIVEMNFRARGGGFRPDAMEYCLGALRRFEGMPKPEIQKIAFEIAMLGTRGLDVNDPAEKYSLGSIPGKFSGLHLLCIEYVGFQQIEPTLDLGFDLSAEYAEACRVSGK